METSLLFLFQPKMSNSRNKYSVPKSAELRFENGWYYYIKKNRGKSYVLNESMYDLLKVFESPKTRKQGLQDFLKDLEKDEKLEIQVKELVDGFIRKGFLKTAASEREETIQENDLDVHADFKVLERLHKSNKSHVYLVEGDDHKKWVVKVLTRLKEKYTLKVLNEVQILKKLEETGIVPKVISFEDQTCRLVIEHIDSLPMNQYVEKNQPELEAKRTIIESLLDSYEKLHRYRIWHGDIHPKNVLITPDLQVRLVDFGNSTNLDAPEMKRLWNVGMNFFVPPERLTEDCFDKFIMNPNERTEVYQVALLIYVLLYEKLPFVGGTWKNMVHSIRTWDKEVLPIERMPLGVFELLKKALNSDPLLRHSSIAELKKEWTKLWIN